MTKKLCFKCNRTKPLDEFYKHSQMADGYLNKCKSCTKNDVSIHRNANLEKIRKYDRERGKLPHRIRANVERNRKRKKEYPVKYAAQSLLGNAVRYGKIVKPKACENCHVTGKRLMGHHEDYYKPLEVVWLCQICHVKRHKEMKEETRTT